MQVSFGTGGGAYKYTGGANRCTGIKTGHTVQVVCSGRGQKIQVSWSYSGGS